MRNIRKTRQLYESYVGEDRSRPRGRHAFVTQIRHWLGLCDRHGNNYRDPRSGNRIVREAQMAPEEFDLSELGAAMVGPEFKSFFDPSNPGSLSGVASYRLLAESQFGEDPRALLEATGVGVDVSSFADINAWTGVTGGLIERKILEAFQSPKFIADELMPPEPTRVAEGQKVIGASRLGDQAEERQPGEPHRRTQFGERYVTLAKTRENALAVDVTKEAVFFDLTGQIMERAASVGEWIAYRKELDVIDAFIGVTTQSGGKYQFVYKGVAANTYATSRTNGYLNQQSNVLNDWQALQNSWLLFVRMQDPETSTRILTAPDAIVVNPGNLATAELILGATETERRTAGAATQSTAATLQIARTPGSPFAKRVTKLIWSPLIEQRCTDASGLNLSQTDATNLWFHFEYGRPFRYMQNWPLNVMQAPSTNYDMIDRGLVASYFANERGMPSVWSPWHIVKNTT
jgi:hypothetical protein